MQTIRKDRKSHASDPKRRCTGLCRDSGVPQRHWINTLDNRTFFDCILQVLVLTSFCPETDMIRAGSRDGTICEGCLCFSYTDLKCRLSGSIFIEGADNKRLDDSVQWIEIIPRNRCVKPLQISKYVHLYPPQNQNDHDFMVGAMSSVKWILGWLRAAVKIQVPGTHDQRHKQAQREAWQVHRATFLFLWFATVRHCRYSPQIHMGACTYNKWMGSMGPWSRKGHWLFTNDLAKGDKLDTEISMIPPTRDFLWRISKFLKPGHYFHITQWMTCVYLIWNMSLMRALNHISPRFKNEQGTYCFIGGMRYHLSECPHIFRPAFPGHVDMVNDCPSNVYGSFSPPAPSINLKTRPHYVGITGIFPMCAPTHGLRQLIYNNLRADEEKTLLCLPHVWLMIAECLYCRDAFVKDPYVGECCNKDTADEVFSALLREEFGE